MRSGFLMGRGRENWEGNKRACTVILFDRPNWQALFIPHSVINMAISMPFIVQNLGKLIATIIDCILVF